MCVYACAQKLRYLFLKNAHSLSFLSYSIVVSGRIEVIVSASQPAAVPPTPVSAPAVYTLMRVLLIAAAVLLSQAQRRRTRHVPIERMPESWEQFFLRYLQSREYTFTHTHPMRSVKLHICASPVVLLYFYPYSFLIFLLSLVRACPLLARMKHNHRIETRAVSFLIHPSNPFILHLSHTSCKKRAVYSQKNV